MTGSFPNNKDRGEGGPRYGSGHVARIPGSEVIRVPSGSVQEVPLLCDTEGDHIWRAVLEEGARLHLCVFVLAGGSGVAGGTGGTGGAEGSVNADENARVHLSVEVDLAGPGAEFRLDGLFLASAEGYASIDVRVNHLTPDATSRQLVKGIATDRATGEFSGMVYVARDAQRTDATQQNRNICLTDSARIFTRPGLEIYADDVRCGHGASVGQLDGEAVYYMRQRGISEAEARRMQLVGFAAEIIDRCPSEETRNIVSAHVARI